MSSGPELLVTRERAVTRLTLNRPRYRNAASLSMIQHLATEVEQLYANPPRVVIIDATNPGFCSGIDLNESKESSPEYVHQRSEIMLNMISRLRQLPVPVIAAIDGVAIGFGCELLISADIRIASPNSRFAYYEPRVAVPTPAHRLIQIVGLTHAQDLLLTARMIDAEEAREMGMITWIAEDVPGRTDEIVEQIKQLAPLSLSKTKENIYLSIEAGAEASIQHHIAGVTEASGTNDRKEALQAFAEKRRPEFTGT